MAGALLSEGERKRIEEYLKTANEVHEKRGRLLLLYDDGHQTYQAAEQAGYSRSQARYWKQQFLLNGIKIFPGLEDDGKGEYDNETILATDEVVSEETRGSLETSRQETKELPFPETRKNPGIVPEDTLAEAGRKIWLYQFAEMINNEEATRLGEDIEALHDMRVATRRMRTAYDVFGKAFKSKVNKQHLSGLRATGRALGKVRDLDVLIEKLVKYQGSLQNNKKIGIDPLLSVWKLERENARQELIAYLDSKEYFQFLRTFNRFVQAPGEGVKVSECDAVIPCLVRDIVPILIYKRLGSVRAYDAILDNASDLQLHALRIEFKKLRYAVEYFREILGVQAQEVIDDLKRVQDHLGDFHDAVVACELVTNFLKNWEKSQMNQPLVERKNPEQIVSYLAYLHAERHRLIITMPETWRMFIRSEFRSNLANAISVL